MKTAQLVTITVLLAFMWLAGFYTGRTGGRAATVKSVTVTIPDTAVAADMVETAPDTVFVPVRIHAPGPERVIYSSAVQRTAPEVVPIDSVPAGPERDSALYAAVADWNTRRDYSGTVALGTEGSLNYRFSVVYNRAGGITYHFIPTRAAVTPDRRIRPTIGGEYYSNGQWAIGGGVAYGSFGLNVRLLTAPATGKAAVGIGAQILL